MKMLAIFFSLIILPINATAQKHDYIWTSGYLFSEPDPNFGGTNIDFNEEPPLIYKVDRNMNFNKTIASICDYEGSLLFYTNGIAIENAVGQIMENGDSINNDGVTQELYATLGLPITQGAIILNLPRSEDSIYYIFYMSVDHEPGGLNSHFPKLFYSTININGNNGMGKLVEKDILVIEDTLAYGRISAVKHANGIDWWVLLSEWDDFTHKFYKILLTPNGIESIEKKAPGPNIFYTAGSVGQSVFSPDGKFYARHDIRFDPFSVIDIYDFDRCTGELSLLSHFEMNDTTFLSGGLAFSPDSRFLYVTTRDFVYQFDMWANDIEASKTLVAEYDGFVGHSFPSWFTVAQLAPNGKIYFASAVSDTVLHVINTPNQPSLDCHVRQHSVFLPTLNEKSLPNFPNYRLGPLDGSPCDTLGLDNHPLAGFAHFAEELTVTFSDNSHYRPEEWEWDFGDGQGSTERNPIHAYSEPGEYHVCLTVRNEIDEDTYCRWVEVDTMTAVNTLEAGEKGKVAVFPSPASNQFNLQFDLPHSGIVSFSLHGVAGRKVRTWDLPSGKQYFTLPLFGVAEGLYFWVVSVEGKRLGSGKVMVAD